MGASNKMLTTKGWTTKNIRRALLAARKINVAAKRGSDLIGLSKNDG